MYKNITGLKKLKIKIIKKRKDNILKMEEERKKENSTELKKPNVETEVYSNNKECD